MPDAQRAVGIEGSSTTANFTLTRAANHTRLAQRRGKTKLRNTERSAIKLHGRLCQVRCNRDHVFDEISSGEVRLRWTNTQIEELNKAGHVEAEKRYVGDTGVTFSVSTADHLCDVSFNLFHNKS